MKSIKTKINTITFRRNTIRLVLALNGLVFCSLLVLYIINLLLIFPWTPSQLITADKLEPCELVVFLGGGSGYERIDYAIQLFEQGYGKTLYTPHLMKNKDYEYVTAKLNRLDLSTYYYSGDIIDSTYKESLQTKEFVKDHHIKSILLVTSPYHSLRARWIFRKVMPGIKIVSAPCCLDSDSLHKKLKSYHGDEQRKFLLYYLLYAWRNYAID